MSDGPVSYRLEDSIAFITMDDGKVNVLGPTMQQALNDALDHADRDNVGAVVKFATPTIANGEVYVGTLNSLVVYGLTPPAGTVPKAPVLTALLNSVVIVLAEDVLVDVEVVVSELD